MKAFYAKDDIKCEKINEFWFIKPNLLKVKKTN